MYMNKKLVFGLCLSLSLVIAGCGEKEKEAGEKEKATEIPLQILDFQLK